MTSFAAIVSASIGIGCIVLSIFGPEANSDGSSHAAILFWIGAIALDQRGMNLQRAEQRTRTNNLKPPFRG